MSETEDRNNRAGPGTDDPSYSVMFRDDVGAERTGRGRITLSRKGRVVLDSPVNPLVERLIEGPLTEMSIDDLAESEANPSVLYYLCERLFSAGLLKGRCAVGGKELFSLVPAPGWHAWREPLPASLPGLSPRACLRRDGHCFVLEMPLSRRKCLFRDARCLVWLMEAVAGDWKPPVEEGPRKAFYRALWLMGALEEGAPGQEIWEFHDLLFFHHSSIGFHDDPIGATWRLKDRLPPEQPFKPSTGGFFPLPAPSGHLMDKVQTPFAEVLSNRRTTRTPGSVPITLEEVGALLYLSARVQEVRGDPTDFSALSLRPSPSGGALHSLEIYALIRECSGLDQGAWRYDPVRHGMESVAADKRLLHAYLEENPYPAVEGAAPSHVRLVVTSRILRDLWKYEKIAYRLVLQDLGCLYQTISLAATALGLASCILGVVDARRLAAILHLEPLIEPVVGEMTLSSR